MASQAAVNLIEDQKWLDTASTSIQKSLAKAIRSGGDPLQVVRNFLHGTWLGHPLHPILTDIPTGSWTAAMILDVTSEIAGNEELQTAADSAVTIGLLGAVGAALSGLNDWQETDAGPRNIGLMHAMLNIAATSCYTASMFTRRDRQLTLMLRILGFAFVTASAYLGGHLVYEEQIGVDHTKGQPFPEKYTPVIELEKLRDNKLTGVEHDGARILLVKQGEDIHAISEVCPHLGGPLAEGKFDAEKCSVTCPWHASEFSLIDGYAINGPTAHPAPCFDTRVRNGMVEVKLRRD